MYRRRRTDKFAYPARSVSYDLQNDLHAGRVWCDACFGVPLLAVLHLQQPELTVPVADYECRRRAANRAPVACPLSLRRQTDHVDDFQQGGEPGVDVHEYPERIAADNHVSHGRTLWVPCLRGLSRRGSLV